MGGAATEETYVQKQVVVGKAWKARVLNAVSCFLMFGLIASPYAWNH